MSEQNTTTWKTRLILFLKGMAMGAADTVPGVSGGTIAFITNIYEELIFSIQACNLSAIYVLLKKGPKAFWQQINGTFLLTLFLGIVSAAFILANIVVYLLHTFEPMVMAFFVGLIVASALFLRKQVVIWEWKKILLLMLGILLALVLNFLPESNQQSGMLYIFFSGGIAICAMILPGISGAFILVLLGSYQSILQAVQDLNMILLLSFICGCVLGLLSFSKFLAFLLKHYHEFTLAFLLGVLLGSLYTIWPSSLFTEPTLTSLALFSVLVCLGFFIVYFLEKFGIQNNK